MKTEIDILKYIQEEGVILNWENNFSIKVLGGDEIIIKANCAGLFSLARHLLTLAQEGVPNGSHIHLDEYNSLEEKSAELIVERVEYACLKKE